MTTIDWCRLIYAEAWLHRWQYQRHMGTWYAATVELEHNWEINRLLTEAMRGK